MIGVVVQFYPLDLRDPKECKSRTGGGAERMDQK